MYTYNYMIICINAPRQLQGCFLPSKASPDLPQFVGDVWPLSVANWANCSAVLCSRWFIAVDPHRPHSENKEVTGTIKQSTMDSSCVLKVYTNYVIFWLVVSNMTGLFSITYGISSFPLTNIFRRG